MFSARFQLSKLVLASTAAAALLGGGTSLAAQTPPAVYFACHVPLTGTVYRIKETGLKIACTPGHIEFSWTDGAGAVRTTDPLGGDLSGVLSNATVVRLLGRALSTTPPLAGQVLAWNGTAWTPTTAASGGATSHGALTGLGNDDHPQYLLADGVRGTTNGFAVTGTIGTGTIPATGGGTRLMWYPGKGALRAGSVVDTRWDNANIGTNSVALGQNTLASGNNAVAIGGWGSATGSGSVALGEVLASGAGSIALGNGGTTASGADAVAIGRVVTATGFGAIAIGNNSQASGDYSMALGQTASTGGHRGAFVYSDVSNGLMISATAPNQFLARASGGFRFRTAADLSTGCDIAGGNLTCTGTITGAGGSGVSNHGALTGLGNDDHPQYLLANGARGTTNGFAVTGTFGTGAIPATGGGTRLMWYPGKAALRAGSVVDTRWDDANVGANSVALGQNLLASGNGAIAIGSWGMATGSGSLALGEVLSSGAGSIALGNGGTTASGDDAVAIGRVVSATGFGAIAIGNFSHASGDYSIALGQTASTAGHRGAFVYSDVSNGLAISATAPNQFLARASGGFRFRTSASLATGCDLPAGSGTFSCTSSRLAKEAFSDLDGEQVLGKIASLSIQSWRYRTDSTGARHVGPTAQDFRAAFGLGDSDEAISLVDIDGINLLGVQALERRTRLLERENLELRARLERLEAALKRFENR